ncbi:MAG: hypothetical protein ALECFALPRED_005045 [Alectoria fallacina]|uniref:RING-type domain-containing protein n=1 Tax=Alectoria fallacina TaxID=1903189 RepID=A0A8H3G1Y9_9LECA|nr:MAG: hypothetical protein ALECFALPRED_005045 [Alectoria fallacina]
MADQGGTQVAHIVVDLSIENFHHALRTAFNQQVEAVIADLEATYYQSRRRNNSQVPGVHVSLNIDYNIRFLDTNADLSDEIARLDSEYGDPLRETNQNNNTGELLDENFQSLFLSSAARLLDSLPVVSLDDLQEDSQNCPVSLEAFPGSDSSEADFPVTLHCNHVIGRACVEKWMSGNNNNNSCPMCRAAIFEPAVLTALANQEEARIGVLIAVEHSQAAPPEIEVLTAALANEERLEEAGGSGSHDSDEVETQLLALEREGQSRTISSE